MSIKEEILKRTEEEVQKILTRAEKIRERELSSVNQRKERVLKEEKAKIDRKLEMEKKRELANLELEFRLKYLISREKLFQDFMNKFQEELKDFPRDDAYFSFLVQKIILAKEEIKSSKFIIYLNPRDLELYRERLKSEMGSDVKLEITKILGGVIVKSEDSKITYDASLENLLSLNLEEFRTLVFEVLKNGTD